MCTWPGGFFSSDSNTSIDEHVLDEITIGSKSSFPLLILNGVKISVSLCTLVAESFSIKLDKGAILNGGELSMALEGKSVLHSKSILLKPPYPELELQLGPEGKGPGQKTGKVVMVQDLRIWEKCWCATVIIDEVQVTERLMMKMVKLIGNKVGEEGTVVSSVDIFLDGKDVKQEDCTLLDILKEVCCDNTIQVPTNAGNLVLYGMYLSFTGSTFQLAGTAAKIDNSELVFATRIFINAQMNGGRWGYDGVLLPAGKGELKKIFLDVNDNIGMNEEMLIISSEEGSVNIFAPIHLDFASRCFLDYTSFQSGVLNQMKPIQGIELRFVRKNMITVQACLDMTISNRTKMLSLLLQARNCRLLVSGQLRSRHNWLLQSFSRKVVGHDVIKRLNMAISRTIEVDENPDLNVEMDLKLPISSGKFVFIQNAKGRLDDYFLGENDCFNNFKLCSDNFEMRKNHTINFGQEEVVFMQSKEEVCISWTNDCSFPKSGQKELWEYKIPDLNVIIGGEKFILKSANNIQFALKNQIIDGVDPSKTMNQRIDDSVEDDLCLEKYPVLFKLQVPPGSTNPTLYSILATFFQQSPFISKISQFTPKTASVLEDGVLKCLVESYSNIEFSENCESLDIEGTIAQSDIFGASVGFKVRAGFRLEQESWPSIVVKDSDVNLDDWNLIIDITPKQEWDFTKSDFVQPSTANTIPKFFIQDTRFVFSTIKCDYVTNQTISIEAGLNLLFLVKPPKSLMAAETVLLQGMYFDENKFILESNFYDSVEFMNNNKYFQGGQRCGMQIVFQALSPEEAEGSMDFLPTSFQEKMSKISENDPKFTELHEEYIRLILRELRYGGENDEDLESVLMNKFGNVCAALDNLSNGYSAHTNDSDHNKEKKGEQKEGKIRWQSLLPPLRAYDLRSWVLGRESFTSVYVIITGMVTGCDMDDAQMITMGKLEGQSPINFRGFLLKQTVDSSPVRSLSYLMSNMYPLLKKNLKEKVFKPETKKNLKEKVFKPETFGDFDSFSSNLSLKHSRAKFLQSIFLSSTYFSTDVEIPSPTIVGKSNFGGLHIFQSISENNNTIEIKSHSKANEKKSVGTTNPLFQSSGNYSKDNHSFQVLIKALFPSDKDNNDASASIFEQLCNKIALGPNASNLLQVEVVNVLLKSLDHGDSFSATVELEHGIVVEMRLTNGKELMLLADITSAFSEIFKSAFKELHPTQAVLTFASNSTDENKKLLPSIFHNYCIPKGIQLLLSFAYMEERLDETSFNRNLNSFSKVAKEKILTFAAIFEPNPYVDFLTSSKYNQDIADVEEMVQITDILNPTIRYSPSTGKFRFFFDASFSFQALCGLDSPISGKAECIEGTIHVSLLSKEWVAPLEQKWVTLRAPLEDAVSITFIITQNLEVQDFLVTSDWAVFNGETEEEFSTFVLTCHQKPDKFGFEIQGKDEVNIIPLLIDETTKKTNNAPMGGIVARLTPEEKNSPNPSSAKISFGPDKSISVSMGALDVMGLFTTAPKAKLKTLPFETDQECTYHLSACLSDFAICQDNGDMLLKCQTPGTSNKMVLQGSISSKPIEIKLDIPETDLLLRGKASFLSSVSIESCDNEFRECKVAINSLQNPLLSFTIDGRTDLDVFKEDSWKCKAFFNPKAFNDHICSVTNIWFSCIQTNSNGITSLINRVKNLCESLSKRTFDHIQSETNNIQSLINSATESWESLSEEDREYYQYYQANYKNELQTRKSYLQRTSNNFWIALIKQVKLQLLEAELEQLNFSDNLQTLVTPEHKALLTMYAQQKALLMSLQLEKKAMDSVESTIAAHGNNMRKICLLQVNDEFPLREFDTHSQFEFSVQFETDVTENFKFKCSLDIFFMKNEERFNAELTKMIVLLSIMKNKAVESEDSCFSRAVKNLFDLAKDGNSHLLVGKLDNFETDFKQTDALFG